MCMQNAFGATSALSYGANLSDEQSQVVMKIKGELKDLHALALDNELGMLGYLIEMALLEAAGQVKE